MPSFSSLGRADAFPGGGDLDQYAVTANAGLFVQVDQAMRTLEHASVSNDRRASTSVEMRPGITFRIS
jgi:hypothetical protein